MTQFRVFSSGRSPDEVLERIRLNDLADPAWREKRHPSGAPMYSAEGMLLDDQGNRSIFDDIDE